MAGPWEMVPDASTCTYTWTYVYTHIEKMTLISMQYTVSAHNIYTVEFRVTSKCVDLLNMDEEWSSHSFARHALGLCTAGLVK